MSRYDNPAEDGMMAGRAENRAGAHETYQARRREIDRLVGRIQEALTVMDRDETGDPTNWGYAGDAGRVEEGLGDIAAYLEMGGPWNDRTGYGTPA